MHQHHVKKIVSQDTSNIYGTASLSLNHFNRNSTLTKIEKNMALINEHFLKLRKSCLFADITKRINAFKATHPKANLISLGTGDVTQPLAPAVIEAMHKAVEDMATKDTFHGYGPTQGYLWLREAIVKNDYLPRGIHLDPNEVFINDGAKSDTGNIGDLVRWDNSMAVTDPITLPTLTPMC